MFMYLYIEHILPHSYSKKKNPMAAVAKRQTGEVFGMTPPRDRQFRTLSPRTKYGYTLSLRITHYEDDEYLVEGIDGLSGILFDGGIRENDNYYYTNWSEKSSKYRGSIPRLNKSTYHAEKQSGQI